MEDWKLVIARQRKLVGNTIVPHYEPPPQHRSESTPSRGQTPGAFVALLEGTRGPAPMLQAPQKCIWLRCPDSPAEPFPRRMGQRSR
jgi:hypothetical protein